MQLVLPEEVWRELQDVDSYPRWVSCASFQMGFALGSRGHVVLLAYLRSNLVVGLLLGVRVPLRRGCVVSPVIL